MNNKEIQTILAQLGIDVGKIDGVYGIKTINGVKEFQKVFGLKVDGISGKVTISNLELAKKIKNFKIKEFACKHCGEVKLDINLLLKLQDLREMLGNKSITINSGYRCAVHNAKVDGAKNSLHLQGKASDIKVNGVTPLIVKNVAEKVFATGGVGIYDTFVHVDTRGYKARFDYRTKK